MVGPTRGPLRAEGWLTPQAADAVSLLDAHWTSVRSEQPISPKNSAMTDIM